MTEPNFNDGDVVRLRIPADMEAYLSEDWNQIEARVADSEAPDTYKEKTWVHPLHDRPDTEWLDQQLPQDGSNARMAFFWPTNSLELVRKAKR